MMALHYTSPGGWTFKDLVDALQTEDDIRRALESCPHTESYVATYLSASSVNREDRQARGIVATVATHIAVYEPVAALWEKTIDEGKRTGQRRCISMKEWSEQSLILLLGTYDARSATLSRINQVLFNLAARYVLSQPQDPQDMRRSLFVIDEVRRIERLDKLSDLLTNGRKRGAAVILGFQDIEGLRHAYQPQIAHEVIGECGNVAFFRLSDETARWAESFIGQSERITRSHTDNGRGLSTSEGIQARPLVMASELSSLPKAGPLHGVQGYYLSQYVDGVYFHPMDWKEVMAAVVDPAKAAIDEKDRVGFMRRSDEDEQYYTEDGDRAFRPPDPL
jgi:type IV secretory pathway TraG/TraD family ATPase VirD4